MNQVNLELNDLLTAVNMISYGLIVISAAAGAAQPFLKGEKNFSGIKYFVDFVTSCAAGFIVFLLLRSADVSWEWNAASCGVSAYFGLKIMNTLYFVVTGKFKLTFQEKGGANGN